MYYIFKYYEEYDLKSHTLVNIWEEQIEKFYTYELAEEHFKKIIEEEFLFEIVRQSNNVLSYVELREDKIIKISKGPSAFKKHMVLFGDFKIEKTKEFIKIKTQFTESGDASRLITDITFNSLYHCFNIRNGNFPRIGCDNGKYYIKVKKV